MLPSLCRFALPNLVGFQNIAMQIQTVFYQVNQYIIIIIIIVVVVVIIIIIITTTPTTTTTIVFITVNIVVANSAFMLSIWMVSGSNLESETD